MAALTPPFSTATVDVPDGLVDRYVAAGWKQVGLEQRVEPEPEPEPEAVEPEPEAEPEAEPEPEAALVSLKRRPKNT